MTHIHITCTAIDYPIAAGIADDLRQRGVTVSLSQPVAGRFALTRAKPIEQCSTVILVFSPQAAQSAWVRAEIAWALQAGKKVVPMMTEPTSLLDFVFLLGKPQYELYNQPAAQVMEALAKGQMLTAKQHTDAQTLPTPLAEAAAEPPLDSLFTPLDIEMLFFTAAEMTRDEPERAIFLYNVVQKVAPDYAGGGLHSLIERESNRKKPIWLLRLAEAAGDAINKRDLHRFQQLMQDMSALDVKSPMIVRAKQLFEELWLGDFYKQVEIALKLRSGMTWNASSAKSNRRLMM
ncbi:MAG: toll/interleukin-1 receptor domain-containing protein [Anaerolineae bacterium]